MSIRDWFSARESKRYTRVDQTARPSADVPDGVWMKCEGCGKALYEGEITEAKVCRYCGYHVGLTAPERIEMLADPGTFAECDGALGACDPLAFKGAKTYGTSLDSAREKSGLAEAVITGPAAIGGHEVVLGVMDFRFIGASMGSVVGEKIARVFETGLDLGLPVVLVICSGGARMQEGMLSLMQMAKTSAAAKRHSDAGLPYISVLTNPTYGGTTASFAVLADVILAEPGAMIGFAGPRLVEQTIRQKLPKGFQSAEFMLEHGMIDEVVSREELRERVALLLDYLDARERPAVGASGGAR
ncbi:MAG: acetyl-CoA carboxylase carboxyltransferase subunit beta [Coriobacteriales bacterium]|nr:acetyl-CoA carboxylase carboxyltransferase subunit beta [Coriobacteriales bacterium]